MSTTVMFTQSTLMLEHDASKLYVYVSPGCAVVSSRAGSPSAVFVLSDRDRVRRIRRRAG